MADENKWDEQKHGINQEAAEKAQAGVNKPVREIFKESWENLRDVWSPNSRANTERENKKRGTGGYPYR